MVLSGFGWPNGAEDFVNNETHAFFMKAWHVETQAVHVE